MTEPSPHIDHYLAEFARLERSFPGQGNEQLTRERQLRLRNFAKAGFPTPKLERWKYTDLRTLEKRRFEAAENAPRVDAEEFQAFLPKNLDSYRITLIDGHFSAEFSLLDGLPDGITIGSLGERIDAGDNDLIDLLSQTEDEQTGAFAEMNRAFMSDGLYLHCAQGAVLDKPLHLLQFCSGRSEELMQHTRHVLLLDANSQASVIEHSAGMGEQTVFTNTLTSLRLAQGAQLNRVRVQEEGENCYHVSALVSEQAQDSRLVNQAVDLGGRVARIDTNSLLKGKGASVEFEGVYAPNGRQHMDNHTQIDHACTHSSSREAYRGLASGRGRGVFNGRILIRKDAQKTDSALSSDALLLSPRAEIDAKPELEIYADDVKAAHGSTIGQLDEAAVFYLRSRGIDEAGARAILVYSFADELLTKIQPEPLRHYLQARLLDKLPEGDRFASLL